MSGLPLCYVINILLVAVLPNLLLCCLPYHRENGLRLGRPLALTLTILAVDVGLGAFEVALQVIGLFRLSISFLTQFLIALLAAIILRQSYFLQIFLVFLSKCYTDNVRFAGEAVAARFFDGEDALMICQFLWLCVTLPPLYFSIRRYFRRVLVLEPGSGFWHWLCILPILLFLIFRVAVCPDYLMPGTAWFGAPLLLSLFWPPASFLSLYMVLRARCISDDTAQLHGRLRNADLLVKVRAEQSARVGWRAEEIGEERARMREHLCTIRGYLRAGDAETAQKTLADSLGHLEHIFGERLCENPAVDGVVRQYLKWAERSGVRMEVHLALPVRLPVPEVDFFVVLGNLLENALEACYRQEAGARFILVNGALVGRDGVMLSVRNSYGAEPVARDGIYRSSKRRGGPGLGIASVRAVAAKYDGISNFTHQDGKFEASVLLYAPVPDRKEGEPS